MQVESFYPDHGFHTNTDGSFAWQLDRSLDAPGHINLVGAH